MKLTVTTVQVPVARVAEASEALPLTNTYHQIKEPVVPKVLASVVGLEGLVVLVVLAVQHQASTYHQTNQEVKEVQEMVAEETVVVEVAREVQEERGELVDPTNIYHLMREELDKDLEGKAVVFREA